MQLEQALEEELRAIAERIEDVAVREVYLSNARMTHGHLEMLTEDYNLAHLQD